MAIDKKDRRIAALESALRQAVMELEEAANVVRLKQNLRSTAGIFDRAAKVKRELLEAAHV